MKIVFRADANQKTGIGHIMRCLALSEELTRRGHTCIFLTKIDNSDLLKRIKAFHVDIQKMNANASLKKDFETLHDFSSDNEIDWIVIDHYGLDTSYIKKIKNQGFHVLSVDDTSQMHYYSDIVVNQNIGAECLTFSIEPYTILLRGPTYVMLRDELLIRAKKKNNTTVKKILITLGGTDPDNFILSILQSLDSVPNNIEILAVIGPFNPHRTALQAYQKITDMQLNLIQSPPNMADIYMQADLAISAGGSSCYELAYFGIPNLMITVADNQLSIAREMDKQHIGISLGGKHEIRPDYLKDKVKELLKNQSLRKHMSQNGRMLVDGKGKKRIVDSMESIR